MLDLTAKMHQIQFRLGFHPSPTGRALNAPPGSEFDRKWKGKGEERRGKGKRREKGKEKEKGGELGREWKEKTKGRVKEKGEKVPPLFGPKWCQCSI